MHGSVLPSASFVIALLFASGSYAGGLGALCDERSPCDDGLSCRDGFCLRLAPEQKAPEQKAPEQKAPEQKAPDDRPADEPKEAPDPTLDPQVDGAVPDAVDGAAVDPQVDAAEVDAQIDGAKVDAQIDGAEVDPTEAEGRGRDVGRPHAPKPEAVPGSPKPDATEPAPGAAPSPDVELPAPGAALSPKAPAARATVAEDAADQVWGAATGRAIATPALVCGGCLLGAGACTALGGWQFVSAADAGRFDEFPESNRNARIGGYLGLAVGTVASLLGAPLVLVGEGASIYGAFLDVGLCGSALTLEDTLLMVLGGAHGLAWTLAPQLLGLGAALLGTGAWVWVAANGVNAYPDTDIGARGILYGYQNAAFALMASSTIPLGLGCVLGLAGIGVDFGTVLRANALRDEALAEAPGAAADENAAKRDGPAPTLIATTKNEPAIAF